MTSPGNRKREAPTRLLHHGIDRNGYAYPVHLVAWGSGQNALYAYLLMPFVAAFGLEIGIVRLPNLLAAILSLGLCYGIGRRTWDRPTALVAAFLLAVCPWHVMLSRWGLESNLLPAVLLLAVWLVVMAYEGPPLLPFAAAALAVALYAYGSAYLVVPVIVAFAVVSLSASGRVSRGIWVASTAVFLVLALPIALFVVINFSGDDAVRTAIMSIPHLPSRPRFVTVTAVGSASLAERLARALRFLVLQNDPRPFNVLPGFGLLYPSTLPFAALGVWKSVQRAAKAPVGILVGWLGAGLALALCYDDPNANRLNALLPPLVLFAAAGIVTGVRLAWARAPALGAFAAMAVLTLQIGYFARFAHEYFAHYPALAAPAFYPGLDQAIRFAAGRAPASICVTDRVQMPYVFVLFATQPDPHRFLATVRYANPGGDFQRVVSFDRWVFGLIRCPDARHATLVLDRDEIDGQAALTARTVQGFGRYRVVLPGD